MSHRREQAVVRDGKPEILGPLPSEPRTASFVIRLFVDEADTSTWRGHITHVQSNERRHVRSLRQVDDFITRHLRKVGFRPSGLLERIGQWLKRHDC